MQNAKLHRANLSISNDYLDTNVVLESLRRDPEPRVVEWLDAQTLNTFPR